MAPVYRLLERRPCRVGRGEGGGGRGGAWFESGVCGAGGEFLVRGSKRGWDGRGGMGVRGRERKGKEFLWERVLKHRRGFFASRMLCYSQPHQGSFGDPSP